MKKWQGRRREPLPAVPKAVSERTIMLGRLAVLVTILAWLAFGTLTVAKYLISEPQARTYGVWEAALYLVVLTLLTLSALAYLTTRLGCFYRSRGHARVPRAAIDEFFAENAPTLTVLVPSYREQASVIRKTLLSAALQEHPNMRVVLLIDDPPEPTYAYQEELLEQARRLPHEVEALLALPKARVEAAFTSFELRLAAGELSAGEHATAQVGPSEIRLLAENYEHAVRWLKDLAASQEALDNSDRFFSEHVLGGLARDLERTGEALRSAVGAGAGLSAARVQQLYRRLVNTFSAQLSSFERKRYCSLSPEPNKAMNLNSYIGLMGGSYGELRTSDGIALVAAPEGKLQIPDCDYALTLDADSVLLPEYCTRLVYLLERREHGRVAVAQTPYSAYPLAETSLERIAGATTDVQHIIHQGMTHYDATFWVGANAVLRKTALDEVCETEYVGDWAIKRYIQDRTVIEDTESSVDLRVHGWTLLNYPERLSYSATPVDFGSLCIQRRRWANGGLLILGKLVAEIRARRARGERTRIGELLLRLNYMASTAWCSVCLLVLLAFQFSNRLLSPLVFLIAVPYFLAMAEDLRRCGYRRIDVLRVYGFNLLLLPVNLAGAGSSIMQGLTGAKGEFKRTPKVRSRTLPSLSFVLIPYALVGFSAFTIVEDLHHQHWANLVFAAINAVLGAYAILAFVGLRNSIADIWNNLISWLYKPASATRVTQKQSSTMLPGSPHAPVPDWALVLHFGEVEHTRAAAIKSAVRPQLPAPESTLVEGVPGQPMLPAGSWRITDASTASDSQSTGARVATEPNGEALEDSDRRATGERRRSSQGILNPEDERRAPGDRRTPESTLN
ncbi:MAG TPA: glycosyltransferase family 2 protein [Solirubrobacteraceae bacterium]|jgi:cellulose synthase/poly-beta-1,6-N-acetylglucosamine synthase-like glycosyltransferase